MKKITESILCDECGNEITQKPNFKHVLLYRGQWFDYSDLCMTCVETIFNIPLLRLKYIKLLGDFKRLNNLSSWQKDWGADLIGDFINICKKNKIEIRNYGLFPLDDGFEIRYRSILNKIVQNGAT